MTRLPFFSVAVFDNTLLHCLINTLLSKCHIVIQELLEKVTPMIQKQNTHLREAILAEENLAVTLRYLATRETFSTLM